MTVGAANEDELPPGTEYTLAQFTELVATAIANAQARGELRGVADEQAALRRVATLVARSAPPAEVFAAVAEEVGRLLSVDAAAVRRCLRRRRRNRRRVELEGVRSYRSGFGVRRSAAP